MINGVVAMNDIIDLIKILRRNALSLNWTSKRRTIWSTAISSIIWRRGWGFILDDTTRFRHIFFQEIFMCSLIKSLQKICVLLCPYRGYRSSFYYLWGHSLCMVQYLYADSVRVGAFAWFDWFVWVFPRFSGWEEG